MRCRRWVHYHVRATVVHVIGIEPPDIVDTVALFDLFCAYRWLPYRNLLFALSQALGLPDCDERRVQQFIRHVVSSACTRPVLLLTRTHNLQQDWPELQNTRHSWTASAWPACRCAPSLLIFGMRWSLPAMGMTHRSLRSRQSGRRGRPAAGPVPAAVVEPRVRQHRARTRDGVEVTRVPRDRVSRCVSTDGDKRCTTIDIPPSTRSM
jgi:RNaseH domain of pPIWI_RE